MGKNLETQYSFRCEKETIKKLEFIAKENTRTRNQEMKHVIKKYIDEYEKEHGKIILEETEKLNNKLIEAAKLATGVKLGEKLGDMTIEAIQKRKTPPQ